MQIRVLTLHNVKGEKESEKLLVVVIVLCDFCFN